jgi:hypothetical protein
VEILHGDEGDLGDNGDAALVGNRDGDLGEGDLGVGDDVEVPGGDEEEAGGINDDVLGGGCGEDPGSAIEEVEGACDGADVIACSRTTLEWPSQRCRTRWARPA